MAWDPTLQTSGTATGVTSPTEVFLGTGAADDFTVPIGHLPGEISDLIVNITAQSSPGVPLRMSVYNSLIDPPVNRLSYSDLPVARVQYQPPSTTAVKFPFPIGRLFQLIFGFVAIGGGTLFDVSLEWRQDGVDLG